LIGQVLGHCSVVVKIGYSTLAFEIALQRSKDKFGNMSIFSLGTRMLDIRADLRVLSPPDLTFRWSQPSVVAERVLTL
jgi:hypothetical protein